MTKYFVFIAPCYKGGKEFSGNLNTKKQEPLWHIWGTICPAWCQSLLPGDHHAEQYDNSSIHFQCPPNTHSQRVTHDIT